MYVLGSTGSGDVMDDRVLANGIIRLIVDWARLARRSRGVMSWTLFGKQCNISNEQLARDFGIYVAVSGLPDIAASGVSNIMPVDLASPNWMPVAEYGEYRHLAGLPPQAPGGTIKTVWIDTTGQSGARD
jgi:hypothetical protein